LGTLSSSALHSSLAVDDILVPTTPSDEASIGPYDFIGLSSYSRITSVLIQIMTNDRQLAKENAWALRHALAIALYASDWLQIPSIASPAFAPTTNTVLAKELVTRVQHVTTYLLAGSYESSWHAAVVAAAASGKSTPPDAVGHFVVEEIKRAKDTNSVRDSRMLRSMLEHIIRAVDQAEAEHWMGLARTIEKQGLSSKFSLLNQLRIHRSQLP
jgi:E3 ubiquitin-protein ligase listerin